ncbi:MAG: hypothetical protein R3Y63_10240 [Eubacteriales bacterium]
MGKYDEIYEYLRKGKGEDVSLTYKEIEMLIGEDLPPSAYKGPESFWANTIERGKPKGKAKAWLSVGYETDMVTDTTDPKLGKERVVFFRYVAEE